MLALVTGGVRSGKSEVAERLVASAGAPVVYVATGHAADAEMAGRIERHRARRPSSWRTVETDDPEAALASADGASVLVDALGPWIAGLMERGGLFDGPDGPAPSGAEEAILARVRSFARAAARRPELVAVVAEESGMGLIPVGPDGAATRRYLDLTGEAAQVLGAAAGIVQVVVAGQVLDLKPDPGAAPIHRDPAGVPGRELRVHGDAMVPSGALDFAVNVVPGPPPAWLTAAVAAALVSAGRYPDEGPAVLAVADRHGRGPAEVLPLNGSAEAFWLLAAASRPGRAACVHPSFTEGEAALVAMGHDVRRVFRDPGTFGLDPVAVPEDAGLVVTCNPNNPTGTLDPRGALERLVRPGRVVVVDEAFMDLTDERESLASAALPGVVVLRSLTKTWSIPGLRAGYLVGPAGLVSAMRGIRQPWAVGGPSLAAIEACCRRDGGAEPIAARIGAWRTDLGRRLAGLPGVRVWPSAANFLLLEVPDGPAVRSGLLDRGIAVRRADTFPGLGPGHLRVAVRAPADNDLLVRSLTEVLAGRAVPQRAPA